MAGGEIVLRLSMRKIKIPGIVDIQLSSVLNSLVVERWDLLYVAPDEKTNTLEGEVIGGWFSYLVKKNFQEIEVPQMRLPFRITLLTENVQTEANYLRDDIKILSLGGSLYKSLRNFPNLTFYGILFVDMYQRLYLLICVFKI